MNTIQNKKGNSGFIVNEWNTIGQVNMPSFNPEKSEKANNPTIVITYRPVTVKSCGKKQMTLQANDNYKYSTGKHDDMTGVFFSPDAPIYASEQDAKEAAKELFATILNTSKRNFENRIAAQEKQNGNFLLSECKQGLEWVNNGYYHLVIMARQEAVESL